MSTVFVTTTASNYFAIFAEARGFRLLKVMLHRFHQWKVHFSFSSTVWFEQHSPHSYFISWLNPFISTSQIFFTVRSKSEYHLFSFRLGSHHFSASRDDDEVCVCILSHPQESSFQSSKHQTECVCFEKLEHALKFNPHSFMKKISLGFKLSLTHA